MLFLMIGEKNMKLLSYFKRFFVAFSIIITCNCFCVEQNVPRLTVVFVIDQLAYRFVQKLRPFLKGEIGFLLEDGLVYENAYYPHSIPTTSTGHVALSTGTYAKTHGVIRNSWYTAEGKEVYFPAEDSSSSAVFDKNGKPLPYGRSGKRIMVQGVSDHLVLYPQAGSKNYAIALSLKDRSAVGVAGGLGKAIWFDEKTGCFTTSKAYFDTMPDWLIDFNKEKRIDEIKTLKWEPLYALTNPAYSFRDSSNYDFTVYKKSLMGEEVKVYDPSCEDPYEQFTIMPQSNNALLDLAQVCIDNFLSKQKEDRMILWVSFSALDKLGHFFGPESVEVIDMIYQLDKNLKNFTKRLYKEIRKKDVLLVLTSDHGVAPIPELLQKEGLKSALRIDSRKLIQEINQMVICKHGIKNFVINIKPPYVFINHRLFDPLKTCKKEAIEKEVKEYLEKQPGIKRVWTYDELQCETFDKTTIGSFYKNQLFPGRSGHFIVQVFPYCQITKYKTGTGHYTPYNYNTHVPLILYQKGVNEQTVIKERVSMLQFANTLAEILKIPKPPASTFDILPGLFSFQL